MIRRFGSFALCLWLCLATVIGMPVTFAEAADDRNVLRYADGTDAVSLDPNVDPAFSSRRRYEHIYSRLVRYDDQLKIVPDLAESWKILDGGRTYVFTLRQGVRFHNGRECVAEDIKYTFERILDPKTGSPGRASFVDVESIETPNRYTVAVHLKGPHAAFLSACASPFAYIVPREVVEEKGHLRNVACGTGPFMLQSWTVGEEMVLVKNPDYFIKGEPRVDAIVFSVIPEESSRIAALRAGNVDMIALDSPLSVRALKNDPAIQIISQQQLPYVGLGLNCKREPFTDRRVRFALSWAIDRQAVLDACAFGYGGVTGPIRPSCKEWAIPVAQLPSYSPDKQMAKKLLAEAGLNKPLSFKIMCSSGAEGLVEVAQAVQAQLREIGVKAELDLVEWGTYIKRWKERDFDAFTCLNGSYPDPHDELYPKFYTGGPQNVYGFSSPKVDALLDKGKVTVDPDERKKIYNELQKILVEESPIINIYVGNQFHAARAGVKGFKQVPTGDTYYLCQVQLGK